MSIYIDLQQYKAIMNVTNSLRIVKAMMMLQMDL
jgi:hypothetical protein